MTARRSPSGFPGAKKASEGVLCRLPFVILEQSSLCPLRADYLCIWTTSSPVPQSLSVLRSINVNQHKPSRIRLQRASHGAPRLVNRPFSGTQPRARAFAREQVPSCGSFMTRLLDHGKGVSRERRQPRRMAKHGAVVGMLVDKHCPRKPVLAGVCDGLKETDQCG